MKGKRWFVAVAAVALIGLVGCTEATAVGSGEGIPRITARGVGQVNGVPDRIVVTLGVETRSSSASEALDENSEQSNRVIDRLKIDGIGDEDIQTSQFSIYPSYDDDGQQITGYVVTNLVTARMSTEQDAGELIDAAAEVAGNNIRVQSVSFEIDDKGELYAAAREDAVEKAKEQAEQLAAAAGVELGQVLSINEQSTSFPQLPFLARTDFAEDGGGSAGSIANFEPGTQELSLEVEVIYQIDG